MIELAPDDRPREKLARSGAGSLGDNELLAIVIGHGRAGEDALAMANHILSAAGGVRGLTRLHRRLTTLPGIGPAQAARVQAAIELGRRTLRTTDKRLQFMSSREIARYLLPLYGAHPVERFGVVLLDARCRLMTSHIVSTGTVTGSSAHPRDVFREALLSGAKYVVAFHNHPAGDLEASPDDIVLTRRLRLAGHVLDIELADHLILADTRYCSLRETGQF